MARKEKKYNYIYKTTNLKNGKFYVGMHSTDSMDDGYLGSGKRLRMSIRRNGKENFKIEYLEFFDNRTELISREKELVNEDLLKHPMCLNLKPGGTGGFMSDENQKHRAVCANKKHNELLKTDELYRTNFCNKISEAQIKRHSLGIYKSNLYAIHENRKGKPLDYETKQKIGKANSEKQKGQFNSQFNTCWITNGIENKKLNKSNELPIGWSYGRK